MLKRAPFLRVTCGSEEWVAQAALRPTTASAMEVEADVAHDAPRGKEQPSPVERPASLSEVAGPQAAVTVGHVAAGVPCLTPVVMGPEAAQDDSTVAWLLARSLAERQREETEGKEAAEPAGGAAA